MPPELDAFTTYEVSDDWKASQVGPVSPLHSLLPVSRIPPSLPFTPSCFYQRLNPDLSGLKKVTYKKVEKVGQTGGTEGQAIRGGGGVVYVYALVCCFLCLC